MANETNPVANSTPIDPGRLIEQLDAAEGDPRFVSLRQGTLYRCHLDGEGIKLISVLDPDDQIHLAPGDEVVLVCIGS